MSNIYRIAISFSFLFLLISCHGNEVLSLNEDDEELFSKYQNDSVFRFIHISDTHGSTITIDAVNEFCKKIKCDFVIHTGDVEPNDHIIASINNAPIEYLVIPGNHDALKKDGPGQYGFRTTFLNQLKNSVVFPSESVNYWCKDYEKYGYSLRVIALDQFELDSFGNKAGLYAVMTQQQVDWFVRLLEESSHIDYLIVLAHMGFGNGDKGQRDINNHNDFVSELAYLYNNSYDFYGPDDPFMIPDIIDAYRTGKNLMKVYNKGTAYELSVKTNFTTNHDNFLAYFGGHLHWDVVEYLNAFPQQLLCLMAFCGSGTGAKLNDLTKNDYGYNFNVVDVVFSDKQIRIIREGASQTINGKRRLEITFPFV